MTRTLRIILLGLFVSLTLNGATLVGVAVVNSRQNEKTARIDQESIDRTCTAGHKFRTGMEQALVTIADSTRDPKGVRQLLAPLLNGPLAPQPC